jgi:putative adhesin
MLRSRLGATAAALVMAGMFSGTASAQWSQGEVGCDEERGGRDQDRHCVVFEADFSDPGRMVIDGGTNGGVNVEGWDRDVVRVRARVWANARDSERAREIADEVRLRMRDGRLSADGPETGRREGWGVSWVVMVPRATDLDIETHNGGIGVEGVDGRIDFLAVNGGVRLTGVSGDVEGRTTNGGLDIELDGRRWDGPGLDVETTNGGVTLSVPSGYSAELETGTVNGGIDIEFPITVQGRMGKRLSTTLGEGGPLVRAVTTNGGVRIVRRGSAIR